jgi:uncharacterized repeat protein (TIGR01451 family)
MRARRKSKKTSKLSLVLIVGLILQLIVQPLGAPSAYAADTPMTGFTLTKTASQTIVNVGDVFEYEIKYQIDGATRVGQEVIISDTVPDEFEILSNWGDYWDSINGQTLSYDPGVLNSGTSGILRVPVRAKATGVNAPVSTTNTATVKAVGSTDTGTASADVTINADPTPPPTPTPSTAPTPTPSAAPTYDKWAAYKNQNTGLGNAPIIGGEVTYTVGITGTAGNTDPGSLDDIVFEDTLPPGATFVSATQSGVHNAGKVTWTIPKLNSGQSFEAQVKVKYPDDYGFGYDTNAPLERKNTVEITAHTVTGGGSVTKDEADVTTKFGKPVSGNPGLTKSKEFDYRWHGQEQTFNIGGISNSGSNVNVPLSDLVLTDQLPPQMDYTSIKLPNRAWDQFRYQVSDGTTDTWKTYSGTAVRENTILIGLAGEGRVSQSRRMDLQ